MKVLRLTIFTCILVLAFAMPSVGQNIKVKQGVNQPIGVNWVSGEMLVRFKQGVPDSEINKLNRQWNTSLLARAKHGKFMRLKVPKGKKIREMIEGYRGDARVAYAEPNYINNAHMVPNDPLYNPYQWNFGNLGGKGINMEAAWDIIGGGNQNVIVAVIDSGVAYEDYQRKYRKAPDLSNTHFVQGYDFVNNDTHPNDDDSHGTHVTGTIAQSTNNATGVAGIAYDISIMPVKVLDRNGSGYHSWIADGIYFAADNGADVINLSLGGPPSQTMLDAVTYAHNKNVVIVCSAGNEREEGSPASYPAAYDDYCIAVAATRFDGASAYYSTIGDYVDIAAPGGDVTVDQNGDGYGDGILQNTFNPNNKNTRDFSYWFFQGTSMAAPHVSGLAALLISQGDATTPAQVRQVIQETARDHGEPMSYSGHGIIDAAGALSYQWQLNTDPVAEDDTAATNEDIPADIDVLINDYDGDGDILTISAITAPAHGTAEKVTDLDGYETILYTPAYNYNGSDLFTYTVNDGMGGTATATVSVTVVPVNDPPVSGDDAYSVTEGQILDIPAPGLLGNDNDPDGDTLTVNTIPVSGPSDGTLALNADGSLTYTPNPGFSGADSFEYEAGDGNNGLDTGFVTITVMMHNESPVAMDDTFATDEDAALIGNVLFDNGSGTDSDPDGDPLTVTTTPVSGPLPGSLSLNADGSFTYTPNPDFNGTDSFEYEVRDGNGGLDIGLVSITINPVNDTPDASNDTYSTTQDQVLTVDAPGILGNDSDADGDLLTAVLSTGTLYGDLSLQANGSFSYTPDTGFSGQDLFTYQAYDGVAYSNEVTVTINVMAAGVSVTGITPSSAVVGSTIDVTVSGAGFTAGASLSFEGGEGPSPIMSNITVADSTTMTATVRIKAGGPPKLRYWDVRVTNPDGSTDVLAEGVMVLPK